MDKRRKLTTEQTLELIFTDESTNIIVIDSSSEESDLCLSEETEIESDDDEHSDEDEDESFLMAPPPQPGPSKPPSIPLTPGLRKTASNRGEDRWRNRDEEDTPPHPPPFHPTRTPGPVLDPSRDWTVLQLFELFFSNNVVNTIVKNTNLNAARRLHAGSKYKWKTMTVQDFYSFLSIIIYTGLVACYERSDYWRRAFPYSFPFPGNTMTRARFEAILWSLHLSDPNEDEQNESRRNTSAFDRLFKIKPLYVDMVTACQAFFHPFQNVSIEERTVSSKARISLKQSHKPTKLGYKLYVLVDSASGYTWNFSVYSGRKTGLPSGHRLSYSSVMDLMSFSQLGRGYTLYLDNFFTSPALFTELSKEHIGCCGKIMKHLKGFPKTTENDLPKNAQRGDVRWMRKNNLLFVKWMDQREVVTCSSVHTVYSGHSVPRRTKVQGQWTTTHIPAPDPVLDYNKHMGGADPSDALVGYYSVLHKTMKWYKTFFYHFLNIAIVNSHIIYKQLVEMNGGEVKQLTQKQFREELCKSLQGFGNEQQTAESPSPSSTCMPLYYGDNGTKARRYCKNCADAGIMRVKTPIYCRKCQVSLCLTTKRNCFQQWHDFHF
ncbi:piggyBac transposable element-derived protein 4-like isoform X2 [Gouania willdenowi]|uniref:PiggyBac transposable element-derived protein 4-like n=1 Tax=Gouania willdenowi TaxID=441366 RepID=A0A8C5ELH9_GOUWI|nr:piggyBac transposable element-derived protein 4-like isoform X2 [Gouania willdenowi]